MCLSIAIDRPDDVLGRGEHLGFEWIIVHNRLGYRCGYVRVPTGHPWHGEDDGDVDADVHGGFTFAEPDVPSDKPGPHDAWWLGFDCAHSGDAVDPALHRDGYRSIFESMGDHVWTQVEVEAECRSLCEQAHAAVQA